MNHFQQLNMLLDNAYAPYSGFHVAAIVVCTDKRIFKGVNVESAAYPTTNCAERNAVQTAVTQGAKQGDIKEIHLIARNAQQELVRAYPCGSCRQVIAELSANQADIYCYVSETDIEKYTISELLPHAFLGDEL